MKSDTLKVMTVRLRERVVLQFNAALNDVSLRRDEYLREQLDGEVERLAEIKPNSQFTAHYMQRSLMAPFSDRIKVGLKLPQRLIQRINEVCAEKNVPRDLFIESFLNFLANGWPEKDIASPLAKAYEYLHDPYRDGGDSANLYAQRCTLSEECARGFEQLDALLAERPQ